MRHRSIRLVFIFSLRCPRPQDEPAANQPAAAILTLSKRLGMLTATVFSGGTASVDPSTHTIRLRRYGWIARKLVPPRWDRNGGEARGYAWTNDDMMHAVVMRRCSIGRNAQSHQQSQD